MYRLGSRKAERENLREVKRGFEQGTRSGCGASSGLNGTAEGLTWTVLASLRWGGM